ncbi:SAM-dependent methyltransferase [Plantactinospora sp. CA-290183]|uniref:SAM-dependent methyltransferase n=1 Tax=Plantactinospora sp. CA-290183 TaxID=3240006 RepID=UPI003D929814
MGSSMDPSPRVPVPPVVMPAASPAGQGLAIDTSRPHEARRYDYWLGGKDNFAVDRASGDAIAAAFPTIRCAAVENRRFVLRVVETLAEAGVRQWLDIGTGIPTSPAVHEVAQAVDPGCRVVYVDKDPMVVVHAAAMMNSSPCGATAYVQADLRDPQKILAHPAVVATLDFGQPIALLLGAVLHFLADSDDPYRIVAHLAQALPPGSYLVLSHATLDLPPAETVERLSAVIATGEHGTLRPRTRNEIARFLTGMELLEPGLVPVVQWRPDRPPSPEASAEETALYGVVART